MSKVFQFSEAYTLASVMSKPDLEKTFNGQSPILHKSLLNHAGSHFRALFPFFSFFMRKNKVIPDNDILISSSHAAAKAIKTSNHTFHVSYFQARNMKYIWEEKELYLNGLKKAYYPFLNYARNNDYKDAQNPDLIIVNSKFVQTWVKETYKRDSILIYPPVNVSNFDLGKHQSDFFITVGRLEPYKRFDLLIDAFNSNGFKLIVIGDGSQKKHLESIANKNIEFKGYLNSNEINTYLGQAKAFVYAGIEDFGISPVEAQATGCPVICLDKAGTAETVVSMETGILYKEQNTQSLNSAIDQFLQLENSFDYKKIREHSMNFSEERFLSEFEQRIHQEYKKFIGQNHD
jgi:glycosyltransferase involved in cell wall biosynthesis